MHCTICLISKFLPLGEQTPYRIEHSVTATRPNGPGVNERFIFLDTHVFGLGEDIVSELCLSVYTSYILALERFFCVGFVVLFIEVMLECEVGKKKKERGIVSWYL